MNNEVILFWSSGDTSLESVSSFLPTLAGFVIVVLVAAFGSVFVLSSLRRRNVVRRGQMPEEDLRRWRAALVERVGEASQTRGAHITLKGFWRGEGLSGSQKYVVLTDLLRRQVFYPAYSADRLTEFFQHVWWTVLHFPVSVVRLSDQNWQRLASGATAGIVANGDVILVQDSPGTGVVSKSRGAKQSINLELTPALVQDIVGALRRDAQSLTPGHSLREQAESFADSLERDSAARRSESLKKTVSEVLEFAANSVGLWASTLTVLGAR